MHRALYRKWRPLKFSDVVGQEHITKVLSYEVGSGRVCHAYLFCGTRGTGKTTCAKILAKAANCLSPINGDPCGKCENCIAVESGSTTDILEMDAASNTGVDYIRDIRNEVVYSPSMLKNRVYIIDEVHMLTDSAFNALLKTLEEPPSNVIFILATTERQKVPSTILSRCQKFDFRRIPSDIIADRLSYIAENEEIKLDKDAAHLIARLSSGGMRDAISLLELCSSENLHVTAELVSASSGMVGREICARTVRAIINKKIAELFDIVADIYYSSSDISSFWSELMNYYRDMLVVKSIGMSDPEHIRKDILDLTENEFTELKSISEMLGIKELIYHSSILEQSFTDSIGKPGADRRLAAEMTLLKMIEPSVSVSLEAISARISVLESKIASIGGNHAVNISSNAESEDNSAARKAEYKSENKKSDDRFEDTQHIKDCTETVESPGRNKKAASDKYIEDWIEAVGIYRANHSSTAPFLEGTRAEIDADGNVSVELSSSIAKMILEGDKAADEFIGILSAAGHKVSSFTFTVKQKKESNKGVGDVFG